MLTSKLLKPIAAAVAALLVIVAVITVVTSGGRVLGVTAWAKDLRAARDLAYSAVEKISFDGIQYRKDIAAKALD